MRRFLSSSLSVILLAVGPATLPAQSIQYETAPKPWENSLGNHRVRVRVDQPAEAVRAHLEWRRRDSVPEKKGLLVTESISGKPVENAVGLGISSESGDVIFQPTAGAGEYFIYFMPVQPGKGSFPRAKYLPPQEKAGADWKSKAGLPEGNWKSLPEAKPVRWEARTEYDRFNEMEIIATRAEEEALLAKEPSAPFLVFPEDRRRPVRMFDRLPELWVKRTEPGFHGSAQRNEYYAFQLAVWSARSDLKNLAIKFPELKSEQGATIPAKAFQCFNFGGTDWLGRGFTHAVDVAPGRVQPLWCGIDLPADQPPGRYRGQIELSAASGRRSVEFELQVEEKVLADRGDSEPWKHTKLRWLNSTLAIDDEITKPFTPLVVDGQTIRCLGRSVTLGKNGLPEQIISQFSAGNSRAEGGHQEILAAPMRFVIEGADGHALPLTATEFRFTKQTAGRVAWESGFASGDLKATVRGRMEYDGMLAFETTLASGSALEVKDIRLELPYSPAAAKYLMGLGHAGGLAPAALDWKWNVKNHQDSLWLGGVSAGLRLQLKGENYVRPIVNIHYHHRPLNLPPAWHNDGKGGITLATGSGAVLLRATGGARTLQAAQPLHFDFDLLVTPFKPLNTEAQWSDRYYHAGGWPQTPEADLSGPLKAGANIINVHQGNQMNPFINYPFLTAEKLARFSARAHEQGLRVKYYYTARELTNHLPELWAMRSFDDEILAHGAGGGHQWLEEHLGGDYIQAWYEPGVYDASIIMSGMSRWHNLYIEGLRWLVEQTGCDGLYLDDVAYDRTVMQRARKVLDRFNPRQPLVDLHSWNELNGSAGFANCANLYMESFPYIDRLWFGEGFAYNKSPDYTLVEISGIPFGLMGEMLQGGGNPWIGLVFGMTGRQGWGGNPQPIWKLWDSFGMKGVRLIGWWESDCPVTAESAEVKATVFTKSGKTLVALANFSKQPVKTRLRINFAALGLDPAACTLHAPAVEKFQTELQLKPADELEIAPEKGLVLILESVPATP